MRHGERLRRPRDLIGPCWVIASLLFFCLGAVVPAGAARTLKVPEDFSTIQAAIDVAEPGDTVHIRAGHYKEALTVRKPLHLEGEGRTETEIEAPDAARDVITVSIDSGTVVIEALTVRGGRVGIRASLGPQAILEVLDSIAIGNRIGILSRWPGSLSVRRSFFVNSVTVGAWVANAAVEVEECEFLGGALGVLLTANVDARLSHNVIADVTRAIDLWTQECGYSNVPATFTGKVAGTGNRVAAFGSRLCRAYPGAPWPDGFLDLGWAEAVRPAVAAYNRAVDLYDAQEYLEALAACEEALQLLAGAPFPLLEARLNGYLGNTYLNLDRLTDALDAYQAARKVYVAYVADVDVAKTDANIGMVCDELNLHWDALRAYRAARDVFLAQGDDISVAKVDVSLGVTYSKLGRYQDALDGLRAARAVYVAHAMDTDIAGVDQSIAVVYSHLGEYDEALELCRAARTVFVARAMDVDVAEVDLNLGTIYDELGLYEDALKSYRAARDVFVAQAMDVKAAAVDMNLGVVYDELGLYEDALKSYRTAREVYLARATGLDVAEVDINLGMAYVDRGWYTEAIEAYTQVLTALDSYPPLEGNLYSLPVQRFVVLFNRGVCFEHLGLWEEAVSSYKDSIAVIESMRTFLRTDELKLAWGQRTKNVYECLIDLLGRRGEGSLGFSYAERCRARTFLDLLATGPVGTLENASGAELRTGVVDPQTIEADLRDIIASLPPDTAVLEYFVTERAVFLWVVSQAGVQEPLRLEIRREDLANQVIAFRQALERGPSLGDTADESLLTQARDLYALLLQPVEQKLEGMSHVAVIPSGPLHYLPFAALLRSPGTEGHALWGAQFTPDAYFGDRFALSYAPSLVALKYAREAAREAPSERSFLGVADPDSGDPKLERLPEARVEAEAVAALFATHDVYVDRQATEGVVQSQSSTASHVLLSTHGLFNAVNPMYSYLVFTPADGSDGRLHTYEVFGLDLQADLVVLSACETLLPHLEDMKAQTRAVRGGKEGEDEKLSPQLMEELTSGDEVVGLTRAFLYAGTPSVLASLWSVYSEATKDLMVAFYGYLEQGLDKAEALCQAQRDVRRLYPHPVFWGAFDLIGDWR